ncbi:hypothetical protein O181_002728 [Austropuccinia psidii MF-1]|uniref:Uncharacterized protein n=1 Tax=Austropuccinia psidii MF-1 TaxID=1389203 RepID=A0A9Q3GCW6_9BASI|nr:hypothetical protein [Austropuccinia psidii MF-1]
MKPATQIQPSQPGNSNTHVVGDKVVFEGEQAIYAGHARSGTEGSHSIMTTEPDSSFENGSTTMDHLDGHGKKFLNTENYSTTIYHSDGHGQKSFIIEHKGKCHRPKRNIWKKM